MLSHPLSAAAWHHCAGPVPQAIPAAGFPHGRPGSGRRPSSNGGGVAIVHRRGEMHCVSEVLHPLMDHADSHPMFEIRRTCATQSMTDFTFGGAQAQAPYALRSSLQIHQRQQASFRSSANRPCGAADNSYCRYCDKALLPQGLLSASSQSGHDAVSCRCTQRHSQHRPSTQMKSESDFHLTGTKRLVCGSSPQVSRSWSQLTRRQYCTFDRQTTRTAFSCRLWR